LKSSDPRFRSVVFDFDSTISSLEGVEWIASQLGPEVAAAIADEVTAAMSGSIALETVYKARMGKLRPTAASLAALGEAYCDGIAEGARETMDRLRSAGVKLHIVSGGFREAILPAAATLNFVASEVHAVSILSAPDGTYLGYDEGSPLITQTGKQEIIAGLDLPRPSLMVGDGATDAAARPSVDAFAAYIGFVDRKSVSSVADHVVKSYAEIERLVLG